MFCLKVMVFGELWAVSVGERERERFGFGNRAKGESFGVALFVVGV